MLGVKLDEWHAQARQEILGLITSFHPPFSNCLPEPITT
jgi:hypothetical protein